LKHPRHKSDVRNSRITLQGRNAGGPFGRYDTEVKPKVEPETFTFLADLRMNNRKAWMDEHRAERDNALRNFTGIAMTLHDYAKRFDPYLAEARHKPEAFSKPE